MRVTSIITFSIIAFAITMPFLVTFQIAVQKKMEKTNKKLSQTHIAMIYVFCFFLVGTFVATGLSGNFTFRISPRFNSDLFVGIHSYTKQYIDNVILFIPFGCLLPLIWKQFAKWYITPFCGLAFSLIIEATQMFCNGATDIDDLVTNTIGTIIGYLVFIAIKKIFPKILSYTRNPDVVLKNYEPLCYFIIVGFTQLFIVSIITKLAA